MKCTSVSYIANKTRPYLCWLHYVSLVCGCKQSLNTLKNRVASTFRKLSTLFGNFPFIEEFLSVCALAIKQLLYLCLVYTCLQALTCGVVERVLSWARVKSQAQLAKKQQGSKHNRLRGIPKLDDANEAGGKNSLECTLIVTEGDSAKTLAVSGLGVVGRDYYGAFPLRGKLLNVREASHNQVSIGAHC